MPLQENSVLAMALWVSLAYVPALPLPHAMGKSRAKLFVRAPFSSSGKQVGPGEDMHDQVDCVVAALLDNVDVCRAAAAWFGWARREQGDSPTAPCPSTALPLCAPG